MRPPLRRLAAMAALAVFLPAADLAAAVGEPAGELKRRVIIETDAGDDPRPVWFSNWGTNDGTTSSLLRALDRVLRERGPEGYAPRHRRRRPLNSPRSGRRAHQCRQRRC